MDENDITECLLALNECIEEILKKAGYPKRLIFYDNREMGEVISHLAYVSSVLKNWEKS